MRFLCLHGIGTSSPIFEMQTAALRYELGDYHTYEFVEGVVSIPIAPEIKSLFNPNDEFFAYFDPTSADSALRALNDLDTYVTTCGPFDGVIAFSQGATLATTLILRRGALDQPGAPPPFRCGIFFSGGRPGDWRAAERGEIRLLETAVDGEGIIDIPTCHVWGRNDNLWPGTSEELCRLCRSDVREELVHDGGHEVPGSGAKDVMSKCVHLLRRTIDRVLMEQ